MMHDNPKWSTHTHPWFSGHVWFSFPIWGHHFAGAGEVIAGATRLRMIKDHEIIRSPFFETETYGVPLLQWNMLILYLYLSSFLAKLCGDLFSVTFYLGWRSCATGLSENSSRDFLSMDCTKILVPRILHRSGFLLLCSKKNPIWSIQMFNGAPVTSSGQNLTRDHPPVFTVHGLIGMLYWVPKVDN